MKQPHSLLNTAEHSTEIAKHSTEIVKHSPEIAKHSTEIAEHSCKIPEHSCKMAEHSCKMAELRYLITHVIHGNTRVRSSSLVVQPHNVKHICSFNFKGKKCLAAKELSIFHPIPLVQRQVLTCQLEFAERQKGSR